MNTPRRRLIRLHQPPTDDRAQKERLIQKLRSRLEMERKALNRWMARLKRAFHAVEKVQHRITRIERQLAKMED